MCNKLNGARRIKWKSTFNWIKWIFAHEFKHFRSVPSARLINFQIGSCCYGGNCLDTTTYYILLYRMAIATISLFLIWLLYTKPCWKMKAIFISLDIIFNHTCDNLLACLLSSVCKQIYAQYRACILCSLRSNIVIVIISIH